MPSKTTISKSGGGHQTLLNQFFTSPIVSPSLRFSASLSDTSCSDKSETTSRTKRRRPDVHVEKSAKNGRKMYQPVIDANQRRIGPQICPVCEFCGDWDAEDDKKLHDSFHTAFLRKKLEGELSTLTIEAGNYDASQILHRESGKLEVVMVRSDSKSALIKKIRTLLAVVERDIEAVPRQYLTKTTDFVLLLVNVEDRRLIGCVAAEEVDYSSTSANGGSCPSENASTMKALCGIYLLWVESRYRRQKKATVLLDILRNNYYSFCYGIGTPVAKNKLAFSNPTAHGKSFFADYMRNIGGYRTYNMVAA